MRDGGRGSTIVRRLVDRISRKQDGTLAAANTADRNRMVIRNLLEYVVPAVQGGGVGGLVVRPRPPDMRGRE